MKLYALGIFLLALLWAPDVSAAPCTVGAPNEEDGCQTTTPSNPQGDWQVMAFHLCEEKSNGDSCPAATDSAGNANVGATDFDLVADAVGIPQRVQFSIDEESTCTAGEFTVIGRNESGGQDHIIGTLTIGGGTAINSIIHSEWRYQFVAINVTTALAGCAANSVNVAMRLYYIKVNR